MQLASLEVTGLFEPSTTTGTLRLLNVDSQRTVSSTLVQHFSNDPLARFRDLRSFEDIVHVTEIIGLCFAFPVSADSALISQASKVYAALMSPKSMSALPGCMQKGKERDDLLQRMLKHISQAFSVIQSGPPATSEHRILQLNLLTQLSRFAEETAPTDVTDVQLWFTFVKILLGIGHHHFVQNAFDDIRGAVYSVAFEVLLRSKIRNEDAWNTCKRTFIAGSNLHAIQQWHCALCAVTKALVPFLGAKRSPPQVIRVEWASMPEPCRRFSDLQGVSLDDVGFLFKALILLPMPIAGLRSPSAMIRATEGLLDSVVLCSTASYWSTDNLFDTEGSKADIFVGSSPSVASLSALFGRHVFSLACTNDPGVPMRAKIVAVDALAAIFVRREALGTAPSIMEPFYDALQQALAKGTPMAQAAALYSSVEIYTSGGLTTLPTKMVPFLRDAALLMMSPGLLEEGDKLVVAAGKDPSMTFDDFALDDDEDFGSDETEIVSVDRFRMCAIRHLVSQFVLFPSMRLHILKALASGFETFALHQVLLQPFLSAILLCNFHASANLQLLDVVEGVVNKALEVLNEGNLPLSAGAKILQLLRGLVLPTRIRCRIIASLSDLGQSHRRSSLAAEDANSVDSTRSIDHYILISQAITELLFTLPPETPVQPNILRMIDIGLLRVQTESFGARDATLGVLFALHAKRLFPLQSGLKTMSTQNNEKSFAEKATSIRLFSFDSERLVSLIETADHLIVIVRDQFGRFAWSCRIDDNAEYALSPTHDLPFGETTSIKDDLGERVDILSAAHLDADRHTQLVNLWKSDEALCAFERRDQEITEHRKQVAQAASQDTVVWKLLPSAPLSARAAPLRLSRKFFADLGLLSSRAEELRCDVQLLQELKALDAMCEKPVAEGFLCHVGEVHKEHFKAFCGGLGMATESRQIVHEDAHGIVRFHLVDSAFALNERAADNQPPKVCVIWDETPQHYDHTGDESPLHIHFRQLCPQWSPQARHSLQIVISPCVPSKGLFSVRCRTPSVVAPRDTWSFAAPFLPDYATLVGASALPRLVLRALVTACCAPIPTPSSRRFYSSPRLSPNPLLCRRRALMKLCEGAKGRAEELPTTINTSDDVGALVLAALLQ